MFSAILIFWQLLPIHTLRLGVELDTFDGHHYISSIASDGSAATLGLLQLEDELLEVKNKTHNPKIELRYFLFA